MAPMRIQIRMSKLPVSPKMVGEKMKAALILTFSLGEKESAAGPAWCFNAALTNPAVDIFIVAGSVVLSLQDPSPVGVGEDFT